MKFQLKALAAAVAFAVVLPAQAAMDVPADQITAVGNSSMVLGVFDRAANVSMLVDLGKNYSDFNIIGSSFANSNVDALGTSFSWDLTTGDYATAWSTFLPLVDVANLQWVVIGADNVGNGVGTRGVIGTLNTSRQETVTNLVTNQIIAQAGTLQNYILEAQQPTVQLYTNHFDVDNGANVANSGILPNFVNYFGSNRPNAAGSFVVGDINQSMGVYQQVSSASNFTNTTSTIFANNAQFTLSSAGLLTYTTNDPVVVVPEADTWAMMLLGLGFMGFAARRNKQA